MTDEERREYINARARANHRRRCNADPTYNIRRTAKALARLDEIDPGRIERRQRPKLTDEERRERNREAQRRYHATAKGYEKQREHERKREADPISRARRRELARLRNATPEGRAKQRENDRRRRLRDWARRVTKAPLTDDERAAKEAARLARKKEVRRAWDAANPDKIRAMNQRQRALHPEYYREYDKNRRNRAERAAYSRERYAENPQRYKKTTLRWRAANRERLALYAHNRNDSETAAVAFLVSLGLLPKKGTRETNAMRRAAALAYVRAAGLLD